MFLSLSPLPLWERGKKGSDETEAVGTCRRVAAQMDRSRLEHGIVAHAAGRIVRTAAIGQRRLGPGVLLGVVVLPFDTDGAIETDTVQFDENLFEIIGVARRAGGDEVPAVGPVAHRPMTTEPAAAAMLANHLHPLDMRAMDPVAELADELDHRYALPFHVRPVEIEAGNAAVAGLVHRLEVIVGRFQIAHRPFAGMTLQIKRHAVFLASVEDGTEALDEQFETDLAHIGNLVSTDVAGQRRKQEEMTPAVGRRTDEARYRYLAVLQFAQIVRQANNGQQIARGRLVDQLADLLRDVIRIGARRVVALGAPGLVRLDRLALDKLQRLGAGFIAQRLALQMTGHGENFQTMFARQLDALFGIRLGPSIGGAAIEVQLPTRFFPAVEAGFLQELQPLLHRHIAELAAHQADLMVRGFAESMLCSLFVAHARCPFPKNTGVASGTL